MSSITNSMVKNSSYPPQFAMYSKGSRQQNLIIVGLRDDAYNTIFRARIIGAIDGGGRTTRLVRER